VTKPKPTDPWPAAGAPPELKNLTQVLRRLGNPSISTWDRLPGRPEPVLLGSRLLMYWSHEIDDFAARLPRRSARGAPVEPESPRRKPGRPRKTPPPTASAPTG
jgi:hypothetical protein